MTLAQCSCYGSWAIWVIRGLRRRRLHRLQRQRRHRQCPHSRRSIQLGTRMSCLHRLSLVNTWFPVNRDAIPTPTLCGSSILVSEWTSTVTNGGRR